ncbi:hypothetical protein DSO57_1008913 [Entomophthora muscae]|nr:hypothetical protein DSO57_1008913 [Entomophthora muscae]
MGLIKSDIKVQSPEISLEELYAGRAVVLKVFGRLGCPFSKREADHISKHKGKMESYGVSLVGISFDAEGEEHFMKAGHWNGEMYIDYNRQVYDLLHLARMSKLQALHWLLQKRNRSVIKNFSSLLQSDLFQLGGTFVISAKGQILYASRQSSISEMSNVFEILQICRKEFLYHKYKVVSISTQPKQKLGHANGQKQKSTRLANKPPSDWSPWRRSSVQV